jgi:hypothetical protein
MGLTKYVVLTLAALLAATNSGLAQVPMNKFTIRCLKKDSVLVEEEIGKLNLELELTVVTDKEFQLRPGDFRVAIFDEKLRQLDELAIAIPMDYQRRTFKKGENKSSLTLTFPGAGDLAPGKNFYAAIIVTPAGGENVFPALVRMVKFRVGELKGKQGKKGISLEQGRVSDREIESLVKQLGSSDYRKREAARNALENIGRPALDALGKVKSDVESCRRAGVVIAAIENKLYGPNLRLPGMATSISADGKRLLTIDGKTVRMWDTFAGKMLRAFEGHTDFVNDAALSRDGKRLLTASGFQNSGELSPRGDHSVRLWDAQTAKELCKYEGHKTAVASVAFGPEDRAISGDFYGTMHLWHLESVP